MTKIYAIKDKAIGFSEIFTADTNLDALRRIADAVNNPQRTVLTEHPGDFSLYSLGELNSGDGTITPKTEFLEEAENLKKKAK